MPTLKRKNAAGQFEYIQLAGVDIAALTTSLADVITVNNHVTTYSYYPDGSIQTITEKDNNNIVVKTVTYNYNASGDVSTIVTVMNGKTVTTTYTYDVNGSITSISNVIS